MHPVRTIACAFLFLVLPLRSQAENVRWFEVKSGNFLLYTDASEAKGRRLVTDLEQRVSAFQAAFGSVPKRQFPIEILLFDHVEDFLASAPSGNGIDLYTSAFFLKGPDRMFVVAHDKSPDDIANDIGHALGHVFLDRMVLWHPFWLEEGAAEYFRKVGRSPDSKRILPEDRLRAGDILKIVPSATFKDSDPAGPFRIQAYRLLRIVLDEHAAELRSYIGSIKTETGRDAILTIDETAATDRLSPFTDTRIAAGAAVPDIQVREVLGSSVSIHRGDVLAAARQTIPAGQWYEGETDEARASRAILVKTASGPEAEPVLERAARDFPGHGLVQFHFGSIESQDDKVLTLQIEALERTVRLLPTMGRAHAELARVLTLKGRAEEGLPLLDRALTLEPESADRIYQLRAEALLALRRFGEAARIARIAAALPHGDRAAGAIYDQQVALIEKKILDISTAAERLQVEELRMSVQAEAARREPPKPPPPPPPAPARSGQIEYQFEATNPVEILNPVLPDYSDSLVKNGKFGSITLQLNIDIDGHVTTAAVTDSQIPEMNAAAVAAARKWTFRPVIRAGKPVAFAIKLVFQFSIR